MTYINEIFTYNIFPPLKYEYLYYYMISTFSRYNHPYFSRGSYLMKRYITENSVMWQYSTVYICILYIQTVPGLRRGGVPFPAASHNLKNVVNLNTK